MSRETKTTYRKQISAPARGCHCGALPARAVAGIKNLELEHTQNDDLRARRARTKERNQGGASGVRTPGFCQVREEMVFLDGSTEGPRLNFFTNCSFISHGFHVINYEISVARNVGPDKQPLPFPHSNTHESEDRAIPTGLPL